MRTTNILIFVALGLATACSSQDPCIRVGTATDFGLNHFEKIRMVSNHAKALGLPTTDIEAATVVGAAYAASQIEGGQSGVPVSICLRPAGESATEYRVLSMNGKPLSEWQSTAPFKIP